MSARDDYPLLLNPSQPTLEETMKFPSDTDVRLWLEAQRCAAEIDSLRARLATRVAPWGRQPPRRALPASDDAELTARLNIDEPPPDEFFRYKPKGTYQGRLNRDEEHG